MSVAEMALSLYAVNNGFFDKVEKTKVVAAETALQGFARNSAGDVMKSINAEPVLKKFEAALKKICEDFFSTATF
jgi:F-type H+-transporting ATPase subunit alpha